MIDGWRAELLKQRTTRSTGVLLAVLVVVTLLVTGLHAFTLDAAELGRAQNQPRVFGWGVPLGALFGGFTGAIGMTAEFRHGTVRPGLLAAPRRGRLVLVKVLAAAPAGFVAGVVAAGLVVAVGAAGFRLRGIPVLLDGGDLVRLVAGAAASAALWAALGTGLGALLRSQVPAVAALCVWLLLIENILVGNLPDVGRFTRARAAAPWPGSP